MHLVLEDQIPRLHILFKESQIGIPTWQVLNIDSEDDDAAVNLTKIGRKKFSLIS